MNSLWVDTIQWYFINLAERKDRQIHIHQELVKAGITAERFDALRKEDYIGSPDNVAMMQATPNTIGNWLSHTSVIARARPGEVVGVLEDDALLCTDLRKRLRYVQNEFKQPWDIFFLGGTFHDDRAQWHPELGTDHELTGTRHIVRMYGAWSNQGYLINGDSSALILEKMQRVMPQSRGSDHALIQIQPELNCFAFVPGMVFQIDGQSDIGEGVTKFSNFLKMGKYVWTDTVDEFDWDEWERAHV